MEWPNEWTQHARGDYMWLKVLVGVCMIVSLIIMDIIIVVGLFFS